MWHSPLKPLKLSTFQCWVKRCLTWNNAGKGNTRHSLEEIAIFVIARHFEEESFIWWDEVRNIPDAVRLSIWVMFNRNGLQRPAWDTQKFEAIYSSWTGDSSSVQEHIGGDPWKRKALSFTSGAKLGVTWEKSTGALAAYTHCGHEHCMLPWNWGSSCRTCSTSRQTLGTFYAIISQYFHCSFTTHSY